MDDHLQYLEQLLSGNTNDHPGDDLHALTIPIGGDTEWDQCMTITGTREFLSAQFDLNNLPPGAVLRQGKEAERYIAKAMRDEARYDREQSARRKMNGRN